MIETVFIDTPGGVGDLVDLIERQDLQLKDLQPPLYIDIEGKQLSRFGTISLLTVLVYPGPGLEIPYIIDIHTLGRTAFSTIGNSGKSLKDVLESPRILKVFFDVRNDADALYAHYDVKLQGVLDVQLMESACRPTTARRRYICGLSTCTEEILDGRERNQWKLDKENGERLWNPQKGGSYSVFDTRPLSHEIMSYCVGDVQYLPRLYRKWRLETVRWRDLVAQESQKRVSASQAASYQPNGAGRTVSPWSPQQNRMLDSWSEVNRYPTFMR
ncbi:ribonuclease H-like domain-containing protein [Nemania sp. FL0031]|nr:ribonuclease H-like domain-containing protein [Nemania sp. FL0031]